MRVVLIGTVSSSIFGFRKILLQSLVSAGHEVYIFTTDLSQELKCRAKDELGVNAVLYDLARTGINPFSDLFAAFKLSRRLKKLEPDLVFCYFAKPVIWGTLAARLADIKNCYGMLEGLGYYFTIDPDNKSLKKKLIRAIQVLLFRISMPLLKGLILVNPDDKKDLIDKHKVRVESIYILGGIGLDLKEFPFSSPPHAPIVFTFIGRLLREKGINEFLTAAEITKKKYPETVFNVLGGTDRGNPGSVSDERLSDLEKRDIIVYPGAVTNVSEWLANTSVFVLPSYREGVPRSTQEAMSVGRAVITTDVPGCRETVLEGQNGFMVSPRDSEKLAEAMMKLINNPNLVSLMGLRSREIAEEKFNAYKVNRHLICFLGLDSIAKRVDLAECSEKKL